jgi:hypothetical protein
MQSNLHQISEISLSVTPLYYFNGEMGLELRVKAGGKVFYQVSALELSHFDSIYDLVADRLVKEMKEYIKKELTNYSGAVKVSEVEGEK